MNNPTKWQQVKDYFRFLFCRHKHTEIRTVKGGSDGEPMKVLGKFTYCLDCENSIATKAY